ncbi:MAG: hypothetical protein FJ384_05240 [Verrucomicrobia bacterium]|nr:hypothetical protein [Verrucomicrobiota bacterium]
MRNFFRIAGAWAALVAWLAASGLSADLLQVFAYANMAAGNARTMDAGAAVAKAMADAPCAMCKVAAAARQASEQSPLAKQDAVKAKVKPDGAVWSVRLPTRDLNRVESFREVIVSVACPEMICEVPVPPPKATV